MEMHVKSLYISNDWNTHPFGLYPLTNGITRSMWTPNHVSNYLNKQYIYEKSLLQFKRLQNPATFTFNALIIHCTTAHVILAL